MFWGGGGWGKSGVEGKRRRRGDHDGARVCAQLEGCCNGLQMR